MIQRTRPWLLGLTVGLVLGAVLGAATVSRSTVSGRHAAVLARLAEHIIIVDGPLNGLAGPHVIFEGVNVHVRSGSGTTDDGTAANPEALPSGLGNFVIGYNALPANFMEGDRGGSHTLIVGDEHRYSGPGAVIAGFHNTGGTGASLVGGAFNTVSAPFGSILGGNTNTASERFATVSGGLGNVASGRFASVSGGQGNSASGENASVGGGSGDVADFNSCWIGNGLNAGCSP